MGERAAKGEPANAEDMLQMQALLKQALLEGACGLGIGSTETHRTSHGQMTPSFEDSPDELNSLAAVLKDLPYRVIQGVSDFASPRGTPAEEKARFAHGWAPHAAKIDRLRRNLCVWRGRHRKRPHHPSPSRALDAWA